MSRNQLVAPFPDRLCQNVRAVASFGKAADGPVGRIFSPAVSFGDKLNVTQGLAGSSSSVVNKTALRDWGS
ncbi:hypothetical protein [Parasphingorhabdus sp.]|uniref:hypothetical protein n=1 Tax=Parasphingorhabdus sp. TaxID=2709688 RepID=UPI003D2923DF